MAETRKCLGLWVRKEGWFLTWRGKLLAALLTLAVILAFMRCVHPFLAVTDRKGGPVLVVDGWLPTYTLNQAAREYQLGHYQKVIVVRPVADELGDKYASGRYLGDFVANLLVQDGVPSNVVETLFFPVAKKDRTYHSALEVKKWLAAHDLPAKTFDLVTLGPHARRSRLLYEKAFGSETEIGIIALDDPVYDGGSWWRTSEGVRDVLGETIAYGYARFLFITPKNP